MVMDLLVFTLLGMYIRMYCISWSRSMGINFFGVPLVPLLLSKIQHLLQTGNY